MEKSLILLILASFLLLSMAETRSIQTTNTSPKDHQSMKQLNDLSGFSSPLVPEEATNYMDDIGDCKGLEESEEKCLIRRSMDAHTDYIYTQDVDEHP